MQFLKHYWWFIKESQSFMAGHNPVKVFFQSLYKGVPFAMSMIYYNKLTECEKLNQYVNRPLEYF